MPAKIQSFSILTTMGQLFRYFLTFIATIAILLPSLGLTVVKHTCNTCDTVEFHLFVSGNCSGCNNSETSESNSSCCDTERANGSCGIYGDDESCCLFEIKEPNVDNYVRPVQFSEVLLLESVELPYVIFDNVEIEENSSTIINYVDPPSPFLSGIDFLFFISQLKIPVC